jgi:hypothetical protein
VKASVFARIAVRLANGSTWPPPTGWRVEKQLPLSSPGHDDVVGRRDFSLSVHALRHRARHNQHNARRSRWRAPSDPPPGATNFDMMHHIIYRWSPGQPRMLT